MIRKLLFFLSLASIAYRLDAQGNFCKDSLLDASACFDQIDDNTRTKTWWFHGETETTREGITADLEAFKNAGIGGVVYYDQSHGKAENALDGFSLEWWNMLRFAAEEAQRIGLSFEINLSNGFVAGGKWITYENSMKRLAATELLIEGGRPFQWKLKPPMNRFEHYKDVAVLAFPVPDGAGISYSNPKAAITSNLVGIDVNEIFDPNLGRLTKIPTHKPGSSVFIQLEFDDPFTARNISYEVRPKGKATTSATNVPAPPQEIFTGTGYRVLPDLGQLEVSDDGIHFTKVCDLKPIYRAHENWQQKTIAFPKVKGKYFRLNLHDWWEADDKTPEMQIGKVILGGAAKIDQWEEKAGLFSEYIEKDQTPDYPASESIEKSKILDISDKMLPDGTLKWDVPPGKWMVIRFAYVPTGGRSKHGRKNLLGLECDKMSSTAAEVQWNNYVGVIIDSLQATKSGHLSGVVMDSHEAGAQNWTDNFIEEFTVRRGYAPTLLLPVMMGYVVDNTKTSNSFLFDVRRTIADLISDKYYGTFDSLCNIHNLTFTAQAIGNALCIVGDPIQAKSKVSKPQGEFWPIHPDGNYDIKESSSAAHLYGKPIASAEAYTDAKYNHSLSDLKSLADYAFAFGINEFVICASPYQPWLDKVPGSTGGGRHYAINRNNTWWEYSKPFWDYQARNAHVLRTGKSTADICVYLGENAPVKILTHRLPDIPGGYDFDAFSTDALLSRMDAKGGCIALPDGVAYRMMVLPRNSNITFAALEKIATMVRNGIKIYGNKPAFSESHTDRNKQKEYTKLANELWGEDTGKKGSNKVDKGTVFWGMPLAEALLQAEIQPDISMGKGNTKESMIYFTHRRLRDGEIYFLDNHKDDEEDNLFTFRSAGSQVQLWNTVTAQRFSVPIEKSNDSTVTVRLLLAPRESYFVVVTNKFEDLPEPGWVTKPVSTIPLNGKWNIYFNPDLGGPGEVVFDSLHDWTIHSNPAIKYYSGTAVYRKDFQFEPSSGIVFLETGNPGFVARIKVNGNEAGIIWCSPWKIDITNHLKKGRNSLEIHVANSLINRMVYDAQLSENNRVTYSYPPIVRSDDGLISSGLKQAKIVVRE